MQTSDKILSNALILAQIIHNLEPIHFFELLRKWKISIFRTEMTRFCDFKKLREIFKNMDSSDFLDDFDKNATVVKDIDSSLPD